MENTLLNKPVRDALLSMAAPAAIGMLMTFLFQLVDTYFVGQLGTAELAAISFAYPVYFLIVSFFMGAAAGVSAVVGKAIGEKQFRKAQSVTCICITLFMVITCALGVIGFYSVPLVFSAIGASDSQIKLISTYMQPLYLGMSALVGTLIANSALMAKGVMVKTTVIMGISGLVNLVLDYVLIFGIGPIPHMGLTGAALATVIAWSVGLCLMILLSAKEKLIAWPAINGFMQAKTHLSEVKRIAIPSIAAQVLNPISIAVITSLVASYGENAVAAFGIVTRIESLGLTGILALSVVITPIVAQNYGAKHHRRLDQVIAVAGRMTVYWGLLFYITILIFSQSISQLFTESAEIVNVAQMYFLIVGISLPCFGLVMITTSFFNGVHEGTASLKLTMVKAIILTIPLSIMASWISLDMIWISLALANILAAIYASRVLKSWLKQNNSDLAEHSVWKDYLRDVKLLFRIYR